MEKTNDNKGKKHTAPPRYDEALKTVRYTLVIEQVRPSHEVAKEPGIYIDTLRSWLKAAESGAETPTAACTSVILPWVWTACII